MEGWQHNAMPKSHKNQLKIGGGISTGISLGNIIVIGDNTPTWNNGVKNHSHASIKLSVLEIYGKNGVDFDYLARCFGQWDARLAKWLAGQGKRKKPMNYDTLAAYFRVAAQKHGKCSILLYNSEQMLARHGAVKMLGFIERTKAFCWYILIGDDSLNGLEIPNYMRPRRIDMADFTLTLHEIEIYFSASNILLTKQQSEILYQLIGGWTFAAYMLNNHLKRGEEIRETDLNIAITGVFGKLDDLVADGMTLQERYVATLLSAFDTFPYELALACCPYNERVIRRALEKIPGVHFSMNDTALAIHPLIRAYWQTKRNDVPKKLRDGCKSRAAKWYAANKDYMAALEYAIDAGDYTLTRDVLVSMRTKEYYQRIGDILALLERIDEKYLKAFPMLWAYKVTLYFITMDVTKANTDKLALEQHLTTQRETPDARQAKGEMLLLTAFTSIVDSHTVEYFQEAAKYLEGASEIYDAYLNDTIRNGSAILYGGNRKFTLLDTCHIIKQAAPYRYLCTENWGRGHEHLCYAEYGYLTGNAQQLIYNANKALTEAMAYHQLYIAKAANLMMLLHYTNTGKVCEAVDTWRAIDTLAQKDKDSSKVVSDTANARILFCTGQLYLLPKWIRDADEFEARAKCYRPGREYYIRGCYLLHRGHLQSALRLVCEALGCIRFTEEWTTQLHLMALKMILYMAMDDFAGAETLLNEYYELAAPERLTVPLLEFNKNTVKLMEHFLHIKETQPDRQLPPAEWMEDIRQGALENQNGRAAFFKDYYKLLQEKHGTRLSGNEYIVLQLFCLGYTRDAIGKELGIGKNYISAVMRRVCNKLKVNNEEDAVAYGRSIYIQSLQFEL